MAKVGSVERNKKRERMVKSLANKRAELLAKIKDKNTDIEERFRLVAKLAELPRNSAKIRVRNRCELTGRPRGYYRKFKLSRNLVRELGGAGMLPGLVRSSW